MAVELEFAVEGEERISRVLGITAEGVKDFSKPFQDSGRQMLKTFDMNFRSRGSLYGGWAPRVPQYRSGSRVDTWPLMEKSGRMRRSFRSTVTRTSLRLDNSAPYFVYHQSSARRSGRLPRRLMMKLRAQDADMIMKTFQKYLVELARKAGTR
jgi:phage gpG-like protein